MRIRHIALSAVIAALGGLGVMAYAQVKPVSARTSAVVYKSPT